MEQTVWMEKAGRAHEISRADADLIERLRREGWTEAQDAPWTSPAPEHEPERQARRRR